MTRPQLQVTPAPDEAAEHKMWRAGNEVQPVPTQWMLPARIVGNGLAIVEGDPGSGKSVFLAHLAAAVTTGSAWLGRPRQSAGRVLWLSGEEDFGSMVAPRLLAAGADLGRVHVPQVDDSGASRHLYLPAAARQLRQAVDELGLSMIVIEPLVSFVPADLSLNQEGPSRAIVDPLNWLAIDTGCTVIVTRGLRKDRTGPRLSHGSGHGTIANTARSVLVVDRPDPDRERRVVRTLKTFGPLAPPLEYDLEQQEQRPPRIIGLAELASAADDAAADAVDPGERSVRADAREMLRTLCATEYVPVTTIQAAAEASGLGWRTVVRVKAELQVHSRPNRTGGNFFHEWGPPMGGWPPPTPPVRSTPCALPSARKSQGKTAKKPRKSRAPKVERTGGGGGGGGGDRDRNTPPT